MEFILQLLLPFLIGAIVIPLLKKAKLWLEERRAANRKELIKDSSGLYDWLIEYYKRNNNYEQLYTCKIGGSSTEIPFLTNEKWQYCVPISESEDFIYKFIEEEDSLNYEIDKKLIQKRILLGQKIFNQPAIYLDHVDESQKIPKLILKQCDYYQLITSLIKLEEETYKVFKKNRFKRVHIRENNIFSNEIAKSVKKAPFSTGCAVVFALNIDGDYEIITHTRSHEVSCFGGYIAALPNFGLAPEIGGTKKSKRQENLLFYNILKEILEEMFGYEELIDMMNIRKANPYWFFSELIQGSELYEAFKDGRLSIECLGFGFDTLNANCVLSILAKLDDITLSKKIKKTIKTNFEVMYEQGDLDVYFNSIDSPQLKRWLDEKKFVASSAFAISKALERFKDFNRPEVLYNVRKGKKATPSINEQNRPNETK